MDNQLARVLKVCDATILECWDVMCDLHEREPYTDQDSDLYVRTSLLRYDLLTAVHRFQGKHDLKCTEQVLSECLAEAERAAE